LLGHSWGAFLGVNVIKRRPDLFYAYVGTGQVVGWAQGMAAQYKYTVKRAKAEGNKDALRELEEIGPPPYEIGPKFFTAHKWLNRYLPASDTKYIQQQMDIIRSAPNFSSQDVQDWSNGEDFSGRQLYSIEVAEDLSATLGYEMPVPFFVIQGEEDHITPTEVAQRYFHRIHAPLKKMVLIKGAGHFAYATNREEFLAALVKYVRPLDTSAIAN
jgi:pimeloyl-ACP methyl ester carboxylesterase